MTKVNVLVKYHPDTIDLYNALINKVEIWLKATDGIGRFKCQIKNNAGEYTGAFSADDPVEIKIEDIVFLRGYLDSGMPISEDAKSIYEQRFELNGRDYGQDLANKTVDKTIADYPYVVKFADDIIDSMLANAPSEIAFAPSGDHKYQGVEIPKLTYEDLGTEYLIEAIRKILQRINFDSRVDLEKDLNISPIGSIDSGIILQMGVNILKLIPTEFDSYELRNYIVGRGKQVVDGWSEGNKDDFTCGTGNILSNEFEHVAKGGACIKCEIGTGGEIELILTFPKFNYDYLDFSNIAKKDIAIAVSGITDLAYANKDVLVLLTDTEDNILQYWDRLNGASKPEIYLWHDFVFPIGPECEIGGGGDNRKRWVQITGSTFNWKIKKIHFFLPDYTIHTGYFDHLRIPVPMVAYAQDAGSQGSFKVRHLPVNGKSCETQQELQELVDSVLAKRKTPIQELKVIAMGNAGIIGGECKWIAGYKVKVHSPGDGIINEYYRMTEIYLVVSEEPIQNGQDFIATLRLVPYSQEVETRRLGFVQTPEIALLRQLSDAIRILEKTQEEESDFFPALPRPLSHKYEVGDIEPDQHHDKFTEDDHDAADHTGFGIVQEGTLAQRPAAGIQGRIYHATDVDLWYYDNGTSWEELETIQVSAGITIITSPTGVSLYNAATGLSVNLEGTDITVTKTPSGVSIQSQSTDLTISDNGTSVTVVNNYTGETVTAHGTGISIVGNATGLTVTVQSTGITINSGSTGITVQDNSTDNVNVNNTTGATAEAGFEDKDLILTFNISAVAVSAGPNWTQLDSETVSGITDDSIDLMIIHGNLGKNPGEHADVQFRIYNLTTGKTYYEVWLFLGNDAPYYRMRSLFGETHPSNGDTVRAYARVRSGESIHLTGDITIHCYKKHTHAISGTSHTHSITDPEHAHGTTDPTHPHGTTDPNHDHGTSEDPHAHSVDDPTHPHSINDPKHGHGINDPNHAHGTDETPHQHGVTEPDSGEGHVHAVNDPTHDHAVTDPEHLHTVNDPEHDHGVTDPKHLHTMRSVDKDLLLYYPLDKGSGVIAYDRSINGYDGDIAGPVWINGKLGKALDFSKGTDHVDCGADVPDPGTGEYTILAWVKPNDKTTLQAIAGKCYFGAGPCEYGIHIHNSRFYSKWANGSSCDQIHANDLIVEGDWYLVAVTRDATGKIRMYVNGSLQTMTMTMTGNITSANHFYLGRRQQDNTYNFDGITDEVHVYKRALTEKQIKNLYDLAKDDLKLYYPFEIGYGDVVYDKSPEGIHGTLNPASPNGPEWVEGKVAKALSFDGVDDYVESGENIDLDLSSHGITLEAWVKATYKASDPSWAAWNVLGRWAQVAIGIKGGASNMSVRMYLAGNSQPNYIGDKWGEYIHIVVVYEKNSTTRKLYINGEYVATDTSGEVGDHSGKIRIGENGYTDTPYGVIDEPRIYARELTPEEIKDHYDATK